MPTAVAGIGFVAAILLGNAKPKVETLLLATFKHITFSDIPSTSYKEADGNQLKITVKNSASFLLKPFKAALNVKQVSLLWRANGQPQIPSAAIEAAKKGDDALLRIGLIVEGSAPLVPFFAPQWIKSVRDYLHLPSDRMMYLVVGAKHAAGSTWESPYSGSIKNLAMESEPVGDGWNRASATFDALNVVGFLLMSDGDDTASTFVVDVKDVKLE